MKFHKKNATFAELLLFLHQNITFSEKKILKNLAFASHTVPHIHNDYFLSDFLYILP